jgi:hypothetical protein
VLRSGRRYPPRFAATAGEIALLACLGACGNTKHPPPAAEPPIVGTGGGRPTDACSSVTPPDTDPRTLGLCGNLLLPALGDPSNVYFLLDRSGSMSDTVDGVEKYDAVAKAAVALVRDLGARINVGGAVFPGPPTIDAGKVVDDTCPVGQEVFGTTRGDWPSAARCGYGPVTRAFSGAISVRPYGGTPTASTLAAIAPKLTALADGRKTYLVLATDGGPNCNFDAMCGQSSCIPNIENASVCNPNANCCAPGAIAGPGSCLDGAATVAQIAALHDQGVSTYVIGIPGSAPYASLLDEMATAGGTARAVTPKYYDVPNLSELSQVLASIATNVVLTCNFVLEQPPEAPGQVNVYLDRQQVLYDADNGWTWRSVAAGADSGADDGGSVEEAAAGPAPAQDFTHLDLHGTACDRLLSGQVTEMLVAFGCPTALIK